MKSIYLSGKYTAGDINENIAIARSVAISLWEKGFAVLCPHLNTANFEKDCTIAYDDYIKGDFKLLKGCDCVVMIPGWRESKGACLERDYALSINKPIFLIENYNDIDSMSESIKNSIKAGMKFDDNKPRWDLIEYSVIEQLAIILSHGAKKYSDDNWKLVEPFEKRYFAALMRHLAAYKNGEHVDKDSGNYHLSHALACLHFLLWKELQLA